MLYLPEAVCLLFSSALPLSAKIIKSNNEKIRPIYGWIFYCRVYIRSPNVYQGEIFSLAFIQIIPDKQQICLLFDES